MNQQRAATQHKRIIGRPFPPGVSGNPLGRRLLGKRAQQLADEMSRDFGGFDALTGVQKVMMRRAATLLAKSETANDPDAQVRLTNCAVRVLGNLRNGRRHRAPISLDEHLAQIAAEGHAP